MWRVQEQKSFAHFVFVADQEEEEQPSNSRCRCHSAPPSLEGAALHRAPEPRTLVYGQRYQLAEVTQEQAAAESFDEHRNFPKEEDDEEDKGDKGDQEDKEDKEDDEDEDDLPAMCATRSMRSTGSSSSRWSMSTTDSLPEEGAQRPAVVKHRPCKQKRLRLKRLVDKLVNQEVCNAVGQACAEVTVPQSVLADERQYLKVTREVQEGVRRVKMLNRGIALHFPGGWGQWATTPRR